jgi:hypothetical protein
MTNLDLDRSFESLPEWLEWFQNDTYIPIRHALLQGLFITKRFRDTTGLTGYSAPDVRFRYILEAIGSPGVKMETIDYGINLIFHGILTKQGFISFPKSVKKETIFKFLRFLGKFAKPFARRPHLDHVDLRRFFYEVLRKFPPERNKRSEINLIIKIIYAYGHGYTLEGSAAWRGRPEVITDLAKRLAHLKNPFSKEEWDDRFSWLYAAHLAAAGKIQL